MIVIHVVGLRNLETIPKTPQSSGKVGIEAICIYT